MSAPRRPDPEPLETDDARIIVIGTALWAVALAATLVFHDRLAAHGNGAWVWVTLAGAALGLVGLRHVRRRRQALARDAAKTASSAAVPGQPRDRRAPAPERHQDR